MAKARPHMPACLGAGTGTVGVRVPAHPIARRLIQQAGVPVAAPSANRFGHVSPTRATHVLADLGHADIAVIDGDSKELLADETCRHGIESTVCKVDSEQQRLIVYRRGATTEADLRRVLDNAGLSSRYAIEVVKKHRPMEDAPGTMEDSDDQPAVGEEAPGQLITHYAPDVPTFILRRGLPSPGSANNVDLRSVAKSVVIDFFGSLADLEVSCLAYRDLSREGDSGAAARSLFESLRWAEEVKGAETVFIADIEGVAKADDERASSLADRSFRAASGQVRVIDPQS